MNREGDPGDEVERDVALERLVERRAVPPLRFADGEYLERVGPDAQERGTKRTHLTFHINRFRNDRATAWFCWRCGGSNGNPLWPWCGHCEAFRYSNADEVDDA